MSLTSRACVACYSFAAVFTALSARLVYLAVDKHEDSIAAAQNAYQGSTIIPARRGTIQDVHGTMLARNEPLKNVIADASLLVFDKKDGKKTEHIDLRPRVAALLTGPLQMSEADIVKRIVPGDRYIVLKKKITEETSERIVEAIEALQKKEKVNLKGIRFEQNFERIYPAGQLASHVIGFYGFEDNEKNPKLGRFKGIEGIERSMDDWLAGKDGSRSFEKDGRGREIVSSRGDELSARNGSHVRLTIDLHLQQIVETELAAACKKLKPIKASVVMMEPKTGAIMALANYPTFDPNEPGKAKPEQRYNHVVSGTYEPGSTFKAVTCAGGINFHLVSPDTSIFCENGFWTAHKLHDHHPYGELSVIQIIEKSSNIGAAKIAIQMGEERFYNWMRNFGFGQATGIALPGEARGILHPRHLWSNLSISRVAMGHEVAATPLQVVTATSAIANGGHLMMPQILKDIRDDSGAVLADYQPQEVRRVITDDTAAKVREALIRVTGKKGTASRAHIAGYRIAGKTGTSQKIEDGHYSKDDHITSFVGYVPADEPAFCMAVVFDEAQVPNHEDVGGFVAAPVFKSIAEQSLSYLGIQPDPILLQQEKEEAKALAKNGR
jgi:cell division protein FtsI (penicillin-binding protein 3)/stage V sporulation protein D (sporulation-specific penicillin-binding protein)